MVPSQRASARLRHDQLTTIIGGSRPGAGKSSLLRAGFVPRRADSAVVLFSPGRHPFEECALQLAPLLGTTAAQVLDELGSAPDTLRLLLRQAGPDGATVVVDQFEELFTLCTDPVERTSFLDALLTAASGATEVVLGVRADFYPRCAEHRGLADAVAGAQLLLGPMTAAELRDAIVKPATRAELSVEGALVTELVAEAHAQPGVLPLLSHALLETWRRRRGATLALSGYHATGGIRGALANTAEAEYSSLDEAEQATAQQLLLRLIDAGEDTGATKRRLRRDELDQDDPRVDVVLNRLAASRLITLDADTVELTHEALLDAWPRLRDWLAENRAGLRVHRQLTDAAAAWEDTNRESDALARGTRLAVAREWAETGHATMTPREREFLHASVEAERAAQHRAGRRTRQLRWLSVGLAVLLAGAVVLAGVAVLNQRTAAEQRRIAQSRQFAAQADALAEQDPGQAARLSVDAINAYSTVEARSSLLSRIGRPASHGLLAVRQMAFGIGALSPDGRWFAGQDAENNTALWDLPKRTQAAVLRTDQPTQKLPMTAAFSRDSTRLLVAMADNTLLLWNPAAPQHPIAAGFSTGDIRSVAFSPDGTRVATISSDQALEIRDSTSLRTLITVPGPPAAATSFGAVAFSPDGRTLATTGGDDLVLVRDAATGAVLETLPSKPDNGRPLAFNADGTRLAFPDPKGNITIWDMTTHRPAATIPEAGNVSWLAFDPGGGNLITSGTSGLRMYSPDLLGYIVLTSTSVGGLAVSNGLIVVPGTAGIAVWDIPKLPITAFDAPADVVFADGDSAVLGAGRYAAAVRRWKTEPPHSETALIPQPPGTTTRVPAKSLWLVSG
ncbi:nSTAND1 domain-containing NTPase [Amycolatopsis speibonae]|uniref:Novel STAND NTPase 1 domain-containing protein n=1 Tax=Amycolatopsis speibonae TaxID=1450224 RepID=A0ABV7PAA8_9PSEU